MKKERNTRNKGTSSIPIVIIGFIILCLLMVMPHSPKPTVKQLERACGVHFPPFQIIEKEINTGNRDNYTYKIQFNDGLDQRTINQIDSLCKFGEILYNDLEGDKNPWTKQKGIYKFSIDEMFDISESYRLPSSCRWLYLTLDPKTSVMTLEYGMND